MPWVIKKSRYKCFCPFTFPWDFFAVFLSHYVSRCIRGSSNNFLAFYLTGIDKVTGDPSWRQKQRREKPRAAVWVTESPVFPCGLFICLMYHGVRGNWVETVLSFSLQCQGHLYFIFCCWSSKRWAKRRKTESKTIKSLKDLGIYASFRAGNILVAVYLQIVVLTSGSCILPQVFLA